MHVDVAKDGQRVRLSTGIHANDPHKTRKLNELKAKIESMGGDGDLSFLDNLNTPELRNDTDVYMIFLDYVRRINDGEIMTRSGGKFSKMSAYNYARVVTIVGLFNKKLDLESSGTKKIYNYIQAFDEHITKTYSDKSKADMMNIFMIILRAVANERGLAVPQYRIQKPKEKPIIVLSPDEVTAVITNPFDHSDPEKRLVWEVIAMMLVTTLRLSDAISLLPSDMMGNQLVKHNKKTGHLTNMPLPNSFQWVGDNIRNLGSIYSMQPTKDLVYKHIKEVVGRYSSVKNPHPHMMRKSAITSMIYNNVNERHVKFASGHSANSPSFERYVGHVEKTYKSEIKNYYEKLGW